MASRHFHHEGSANLVWISIFDQMPDADAYFRGLACPGSLFFHPPQEVRIPSFEHTARCTPPTPGWSRSRSPRRSQPPAIRPQPGGDRLPGALRRRLAAVDGAGRSAGPRGGHLRRLPAVHFAAVGNEAGEGTAQRVTFRWATYQGRTYLYAVNDAPFAVTAGVQIEAAPGCRLEALAGPRRGGTLGQDAEGLRWSVELGPYVPGGRHALGTGGEAQPPASFPAPRGRRRTRNSLLCCTGQRRHLSKSICSSHFCYLRSRKVNCSLIHVFQCRFSKFMEKQGAIRDKCIPRNRIVDLYMKPVNSEKISRGISIKIRTVGFLMLFALGFPLGGLLSFISNIFEYKIDLAHYIFQSRRPIVAKPSGLDRHEGVLTFYSV